ncbi:MAG: hypothetical protein OXC07_07620 [Kistimonas sp.]|nr:hypothetical protein [Kistimonas sp.]
METRGTRDRKISDAAGGRPCAPLDQAFRAQFEGRTVQWEQTVAVATPPSGQGGAPLLWSGCLPASKDLGLRAVVQPRLYPVDLGDRNLPVNYQSPDWCPVHEALPVPPDQPELEADVSLVQGFDDLGGLDFIQAELKKRHRAKAEGKGDSFTFAPLKTSLRNMKTFICHIRAGRHFTDDHPLTASDHKALDWLQGRAQVLLTAEAPYELTVHLAFAFLAVYEVMVARRVSPPQEFVGSAREWDSMLCDLEPDEITAYGWGGNNSTGPKSGEAFFSHHGSPALRRVFTRFLHYPHMLIYPSFHPLGIRDFCRFGHLPVHPVGMLTDYVGNADGLAQSPLHFAAHDVAHMNQLSIIGQPNIEDPTPEAAVIRTPCHRRALRQMLLGQVPAGLAGLNLGPALYLLQFQLFHEKNPGDTAQLLEAGNLAFPRCLEAVIDTLRSQRAGYLADDLKVTDVEAARAALWGARLLCHWRAAGFGALPQEQLDAWGEDFVTQDLPLLQQHLDFIARHRGVLRQLFIETEGIWVCDTKDRCRIEAEFPASSPLLSPQRLALFDSYNPDTGLCHEENTDLAYFAALASAVLRSRIEKRTGARVPDALVQASGKGQLSAPAGVAVAGQAPP